MSGFTDVAPPENASLDWVVGGISSPPMKPTLLVCVRSAAMTPAT